jgi:anaerobic ribonucleoside-triphosphate reductase
MKHNIFNLVQQFVKEGYKYVKEGAPNVTIAEYEDRVNICNECPFISEKFTCNKCGCNMATKARWATADCPIDKWEKIEKK